MKSYYGYEDNFKYPRMNFTENFIKTLEYTIDNELQNHWMADFIRNDIVTEKDLLEKKYILDREVLVHAFSGYGFNVKSRQRKEFIFPSFFETYIAFNSIKLSWMFTGHFRKITDEVKNNLKYLDTLNS